MQKPQKKYFTPEEYLAHEEAAAYKSEYYQGEIFAVEGSTVNHNLILENFYTGINQARSKHKCIAFITDLRLWITNKELFTYPDLMVVCDKPEFYPGQNDTILNPLIIAEILSRSTENYDRGKKFLLYRSIPTFQEYILIDQYSIHIEQFYIGPHGKWQLTEYDNPDDILQLSKIDFQISLKNIYDVVDLVHFSKY